MQIKQRELLTDPSAFSTHLPFGARILASRTTDTRLPTSLSQMLPPSSMLGMDAAVQHLFDAIQKGWHIVVVGDYDCDGATGTSIALTGLAMMGGKVSYIVPNRFTEGYGLSPMVVERAMPMKPELFLTVDNGIASHDGIAAAGKYGIPVVVTDHHLPGLTIPDAVAIVNPNQPGCPFESKNIAGCGVMFYVLIALRSKFKQMSLPSGDADLRVLLDIVALGTVADVVKLDFNNRLLVQAGLQRIRNGNARSGVLGLFDVAKLNFRNASSEDLGFYIGPRVNAAGRMDDASVGIACLSTPDDQLAKRFAMSLHATNQERRSIQKSIEVEALNGLPTTISDNDTCICLFDENWHEGIIGVVAGRIKETFYRPTIIFTKVEGDCAKGSARSIPGLHMRDCLALIDSRFPGLIKKFGGHAMAAGLTVDLGRFDQFKSAFMEVTKALLTPSDLRQTLFHDGVLAPDAATVSNASWIASEVWGQNFEHPKFLIESPKILRQSILKESHLKLQLDIGAATPIDAIWFGQKEEIDSGSSFVAKIKVNEWNGRQNPQLMIDMQV
jgi:single-stranded-DNA-specific exonuclease